MKGAAEARKVRLGQVGEQRFAVARLVFLDVAVLFDVLRFTGTGHAKDFGSECVREERLHVGRVALYDQVKQIGSVGV